VAISILLKTFYPKIEIATPSAPQKARNDRKGKVASFLAMTMGDAVIARLPIREAVAISSFSKTSFTITPSVYKIYIK